MGISASSDQVTWSAADTKSVAAAGSENSDDFTVSSTTVEVEFQLKADNSGTPASGDEVDFYLVRKCDPDNDSTDEYENQGPAMVTLDTYTDDPAIRTMNCSVVPGKTYRLVADNNGASAITVSSSYDEIKVA
jgi:hypothetical protein